MESLTSYVECAADCPQKVREQFMISLQNSPGRAVPQAVLSRLLEEQNRFEYDDLFVHYDANAYRFMKKYENVW
jgi:hypothetical protein